MLDDGNMVIALVPARGGSKSVPRKNLTLLAGQPLISYTIQAAQKAAYVDSVWVSSDDAEILGVSSALGAKTIKRPSALADDEASAIGVVKHFIESIPKALYKPNTMIVYLQPTSPFRNESHIDQALKAMVSTSADGVMSVVEADKPPQKAFQLDEKGRLISLFDERLSNARRQDLPRCFYPNGAIYAFRISAFLARDGFPSNGSIPFVMSTSESIDIDTLEDLARAEIAIGARNGRI